MTKKKEYNRDIPVIILCGGRGTRLSEETVKTPKPMVEIGGMPILWHLMKIYSHYGFKKFILALGYKGEQIKQYFYNYRMMGRDFSLTLDAASQPQYLSDSDESDWEIVFVDTGKTTLKGGRIKKLEPYIDSDIFHLTYGDGVCTVDLQKLVDYHRSHQCIGTVTAVHPPSRFGELSLREDQVVDFEEKPQMAKGFINGGFFVFNKRVLSYLTRDEDCDFEFGPLQKIAREGQLRAFKYTGFWQCMDNIRERDYLDHLITTNRAPWLIWE